MLQCDLNCLVVIENDVGYVLTGLCAEIATTGTGTAYLVGGRIEQQEAVNSALDEHARILLDQIRVPVMASGEVKVMGACQLLHDAAHYASEVAFAQVGREDADGHGTALPKERAK